MTAASSANEFNVFAMHIALHAHSRIIL